MMSRNLLNILCATVFSWVLITKNATKPPILRSLIDFSGNRSRFSSATSHDFIVFASLHVLCVAIFVQMCFFPQTNIGTILISINPFTTLSPPLYSADVIERYRSKLADLKEMPPHVFLIGDNAFKGLSFASGANQSVIIRYDAN